MTIKAFATKAGMKKSQTTTATYIIGVPQWEGILVNGGTFTMGKTQGASTAVDAPHQVTISSFYIGKYEVTQGEWSAIFGSNPSNFAGDLGRPVEMVNWYLALVYCNKRSIAESLTPVYSINNTTNPIGWGQIPNISNQNWNNAVCNMNANGYRLPTEAEWEYAARGASNTPDYLYSGSNDINSVAWYVTNSNGSTRRFGLKQANGLGIYDMSGNVWELCWDWYANYNTDPANNPTGPATGQTKVIRGGCWYGLGDYSGVSHRGYKNPSYKDDGIGIRLCRSSM
ncbi:MAG: formylglycine-generating enzyme family protein [Candidatus Cloacimonetes bacterium]|nr:formylglycine-generating enzyme family protein [Candidatus Cloacimonadota bacterium]